MHRLYNEEQQAYGLFKQEGNSVKSGRGGLEL